MASVLKVDKLDPQSGTALEIGTSGDTVSIPSGATLDISASTLTPPATMPASSGVNLTALNATQLTSGKVPTAQLGTGTASSSTILYGDQTYKTEPSGFDAASITGQTAYGAIVPATADTLVMYDATATALREVTISALGNTPTFLARKTTYQTVTADTGWVKVEFNTITGGWDSHSAWDTTNDKFVVPADCAGKYVFDAMIYIYNVAAETHVSCRYYLNGSNAGQAATTTTSWADTGQFEMEFWVPMCITLAAADEIEFYVSHEGGTYNLYTDTRLLGWRIAGI